MEYPVEIKSNVVPATIDAALDILGLADVDAEHKSIYFLESSTPTEHLALYAQDVILRLRVADDGSDCTLKFRPCHPAMLPANWSTAQEKPGWKFGIEQDWSGITPSLSASLVTDLDSAVGKTAVATLDLSPVISKDQLDLFSGYTSQPLVMAQLRLLGPISARKWKIKSRDRVNNLEVGHKINVEEWVIGDNKLRFLELSGREDDMTTAVETRRQLDQLYTRLDLSVSADQQLKTKIVLDHFSSP